MHVIHIGQVPLPDNHRCGNYVAKNASNPSRWVINLAKAQQRFTDIQPEIVVKVPGGSHEWKTRIEDILCHFVPIPNILRGKTGVFFDQQIIAKVVCMLSPDIVHAHSSEEANTWAALRTPYPRLLIIQGCFFVLNRFARPKFISRPWII